MAEKQTITVLVAGKNYTLASYDPPEYVRRVAEYVDRKLSETMAATNLSSAQGAVLTCFQLADELMKAQDENRMLQRRMEAAAEEREAARAEAPAREETQAEVPAREETRTETTMREETRTEAPTREETRTEAPRRRIEKFGDKA